MKVILCCDNSNGIMFNKRRVSRDAVVVKKIIEFAKDSKLWVSRYSHSLFENDNISNINIAESVLLETAKGEYCFVEGEKLKQSEKWIEEIIVFRWNIDYPSDFKLDIDLCKWKLKHTEDFQGNSHECITLEVYSK